MRFSYQTTGVAPLINAARPLGVGLLLTSLVLACADNSATEDGAAGEVVEPTSGPVAHNTLSDAEQAGGWMLLFDGESTDGWHGYNQDAFPESGWAVRDGDLTVFSSDGSEEGLGGDIVSDASFSDFELVFDFLVSPVGNSGVFYRVVEAEGRSMWMVAPEFQVLDDAAYVEMGTMDMNTHLTGDNYDLHSSTVAASSPIGEWNRARIVVDGSHVEHWLNGLMTVSYELWSAEWKALVAKSKFGEYEEYGSPSAGSIGIQDHGHDIRYRNIKIRRLPAAGSTAGDAH